MERSSIGVLCLDSVIMKAAREARKIRARAATAGWKVKLLASNPSRAMRETMNAIRVVAPIQSASRLSDRFSSIFR